MKAFQPKPGATVSIDVSDTSQSVSIDFGGCNAIEVANAGSATAFIRFGGIAPTAINPGDKPVLAGVTEVLTPGAEQMTIYVAAIAAGATGKIYFTPGVGI
jgi:hypothetical protein